jgi:hypothetical protein
VAGGGDEDLCIKVVAHELVFAHTHVGEACAVELMVDAQRSYGLEGNHQHITS